MSLKWVHDGSIITLFFDSPLSQLSYTYSERTRADESNIMSNGPGLYSNIYWDQANYKLILRFWVIQVTFVAKVGKCKLGTLLL